LRPRKISQVMSGTGKEKRGGMESPLERLIKKLGNLTDIIGAVFIAFIVLITVCDVVLRYFGMPILGTYELVSLAGALAIGISSLLTYYRKSHIRVDIVADKLPGKLRRVLWVTTRAMILVILAITGVSLVIMGFDLMGTHTLSQTLRLPYYPAVWAIGVSFFFVCLAIFHDMLGGGGK